MSKPLEPHYASDLGAIIQVTGEGVLLAAKAGAPTEAAKGYRKSCLYIDLTNSGLWINTGTVDEASWSSFTQS